MGRNAVSRRRHSRMLAGLGAFIAGLIVSAPAFAICQVIADGAFGPARIYKAAVETGSVRIQYIGHSTFEIETPGGIRIATDYNDQIRPPLPPTVATMNGAHSTHYSLAPDPDIQHLLPGWNPDGSPVDYDLTVGDVRIRNIQTNIRGWEGDSRRLGNSIFVFEVGDLCIAHLGHLHHQLTEEDLLRLGQIDVVFAAIDNSTTLRMESMMKVLNDIRPAMVIPMHFHFPGALQAFAARAASDGYEISMDTDSEHVVSRTNLPAQRTVHIMLPRS